MSERIDNVTPNLMLELNAVMSERAVTQVTSLSRASIHRKRLAGEFPEPIPISSGRVGYRVRDIRAWLEEPTAWSSSGSSPDILAPS